jgi:bifunctional non-homologous end joining protein LigD
MSLKEYIRKRDFRQTAEPGAARPAKGPNHHFVIQKHAASRLHYDFRLELDGTLKSWAVPKGVPFKKGEKRLAVQVEDHPVAYADFEGTIPKGQYGGGTVMVWDRGTYKALTATPAKELDSGKLHFVLSGKKLRGEWYLVRLRGGKDWLLIKGGEDMKPVSKKMDDTSALSGRTMEQLAKSDQVWQSNRAERNGAEKPKVKRPETARAQKFVEPMKALLVEKPPAGDWIYEIKFDGFRAMAFKSGEQVKLLSRNEKDLAHKFPQIAEALAEVDAEDPVIDGEIVALDAKGRSSFQLLQRYELGEERPPIVFYVFDLLGLNGADLQNEPLEERKSQLEKLLARPPALIRYSASLGPDVKALLSMAGKLGLEGLIGKRKGSRYEPGRRSGAWIKLKIEREQEMVIGGYTDPEGSRKHFGALLIGYYSGRRLLFAGKVGTGFDSAMLNSVYSKLSKISSNTCPFDNLPERKNGWYGQNITPAEMKRCHWVKPKLVCQIKFFEWTQDGKMRQPVFLGLREDKDATEVVREKPH